MYSDQVDLKGIGESFMETFRDHDCPGQRLQETRRPMRSTTCNMPIRCADFRSRGAGDLRHFRRNRCRPRRKRDAAVYGNNQQGKHASTATTCQYGLSRAGLRERSRATSKTMQFAEGLRGPVRDLAGIARRKEALRFSSGANRCSLAAIESRLVDRSTGPRPELGRRILIMRQATHFLCGDPRQGDRERLDRIRADAAATSHFLRPDPHKIVDQIPLASRG